jgi:hypothetical protein
MTGIVAFAERVFRNARSVGKKRANAPTGDGGGKGPSAYARSAGIMSGRPFVSRDWRQPAKTAGTRENHRPAEMDGRIYLDFLETAEKKRRWSIFDDIPWDRLDTSKTTETTAECVETFCSEELYVPDYSSKGLEMVRSMFGMAWFQACWAFEESKHGLVFREYLTRSGLRSEAAFTALEADIFSKSWKLPYETRRMACYGALQEGATYVAYRGRRGTGLAARATRYWRLSSILSAVMRQLTLAFIGRSSNWN